MIHVYDVVYARVCILNGRLVLLVLLYIYCIYKRIILIQQVKLDAIVLR